MQAYVMTGINSPDKLKLSSLPLPQLKTGEVLIQTKAIDINPVDNKTLQGKGQYANISGDPPIILGWGLSGIVKDKAADVTSFDIGDEVFGLINFPGHGRTYSTHVAAPAKDLALKPASIGHAVAAALTLAALMAYQAIHMAGIRPGERVLIQGIAGGVGFPALQIAKEQGVEVIGTAAPEDFDLLKKFSADQLIDYTRTDFSTVLSDIDFVLDTLGGDSVLKAFDILSPKGRLITIPSGGNDDWKYVAERRDINAGFLFVHSSGTDMQAIAALAAAGKLLPNIIHRFRFSGIPEIHRLMLAKKISGKIIVEV